MNKHERLCWEFISGLEGCDRCESVEETEDVVYVNLLSDSIEIGDEGKAFIETVHEICKLFWGKRVQVVVYANPQYFGDIDQ